MSASADDRASSAFRASAAAASSPPSWRVGPRRSAVIACTCMASAAPSRPCPACERLRSMQWPVPSYPLFEHAPYTLALAVDDRSTSCARARARSRARALRGAARGERAPGQAGPRRRAPRAASPRCTAPTSRASAPIRLPRVTRFAVEASDGDHRAIGVPATQAAHERSASPRSRAIEVIPNFVDTEHFAPAGRRDPAALRCAASPQRRRTSRAARAVPRLELPRGQARAATCFEVLARVRARVPARLLLVGDGPERALAEQRARQLGRARARVLPRQARRLRRATCSTPTRSCCRARPRASASPRSRR